MNRSEPRNTLSRCIGLPKIILKLKFSIFRKPTFTGSYLKFDSYHSMSIKRAVGKTFIDRAKNLCDEEMLDNELQNNTKFVIK